MILVVRVLMCSIIYHLHVDLQLADAGPLALGGAHVAQVMDGEGGTDAGVQLPDCGEGGRGRGAYSGRSIRLAVWDEGAPRPVH